jgi:carbamoyl-phosphate synthase large subunit
MTKLFITGGGGSGTVAVIHSLKALGYEIATADATVHSAGFEFAHRGYVIPFGVDPAFEPAMRTILREEKPDFLLSGVDEELPILHRLLAREFPTIKMLAPSLEFCESMLDKWQMFERLSAKNISVARSWLASDPAGATYPAVVKPRHGRGSRGVAYLENAGELDKYLGAAAKDADQYVVQERIRGTEYTNSAVVGLDNTMLAVVPKEVVSKKGITQVGVSRKNDAIDALCRAVQRELNPCGPFNVQCVLRDDGVPVVFEINPRYSTTVALTLAAGVNEVDEVVRQSRGEPPVCLEFVPDLMMVRYPTQIYVKESEWKPRDLRGPA